MIAKAQIKYIHSLQHKKYRQKFRRYIAEGDKIAKELLIAFQSPVVQIFATDEWLQRNEDYLKAVPSLQITTTSADELQKLSALTTAHNVICECAMPEEKPLPALKDKIALALENMQDPGNFGSIIRIADWFNIKYIICSPDCVDQYNPKVIQAAMGSLLRVKVINADLISFFKENDLPEMYAATLYGKNLEEFKKINAGIICIGNESKGISGQLIKLASQQLTIPRLGQAESLNAAVATGIICSRLLFDN